MATLVEIGRFQSLPEALVVRSCLEAHGHVVVAMEYNHASISWDHLFAIGGVRLVTPEPEAAQARFLIATLERDGMDVQAVVEKSERQSDPGLIKRCLAIVLLFTLHVIIPPQMLKRRPAL